MSFQTKLGNTCRGGQTHSTIVISGNKLLDTNKQIVRHRFLWPINRILFRRLHCVGGMGARWDASDFIIQIGAPV